MFESLNSKLDTIRKNNHGEWTEIPIVDSVLLKEDQEKINNTVIKYPLGSYQIGEIAKLSGLLYNEGVDVLKLLASWCIKYDIDLRKHG